MNKKVQVAIIYHKISKRSNSSYLTSFHRIIDSDTGHIAKYVHKVLHKKGYQTKIFTVDSYQELKVLPLVAYDCIFNLIDSKALENRAAKLLESNNLTFTGTGVKSILISNNKINLKKAFQRARIPTPRWTIIKPNQKVKPETISLEYPLIVKPTREHASVGITSTSIAPNFTSLLRILHKMQRWFDQPLLLEEFIFGRELHATILEQGSRLLALPLAELSFQDEVRNPWNIYGFAEKWSKRTAIYKSCHFVSPPPQLAQSIQRRILSEAKRAHQALGFSGYSRLDIRYNPNSRRFYFLDANANAGFDPNPKEAMTASIKAYGQNMDWFVNEIVRQALVKKREI